MRYPIRTLLVLSVILTGCGNQQDSTQPTVTEGPFDRYLSELSGAQLHNVEEANEESVRLEELIATCMTKEGFDYIPDTELSHFSITEDDPNDPQEGTLEFAQQYGYGIMDSPQRYAIEAQAKAWKEHVDPNQEYIDSLSASEQNAYIETLYGAGVASSEQDPDENNNAFGCQGWATKQIQSEKKPSAWDDPDFAEFLNTGEELYREALATPEGQSLDGEWSDCMADAGFPDIPSRADALEKINQAQMELFGNSGKQPEEALVKELQATEIEQAVADWNCAASINYDERFEQIHFDVQQAFVDAHKEQLDALVARYGND